MTVGAAVGAVLLGGTKAEAADGGPVLLGRANSATTTTRITSTGASTAATVENTNAGGGGHGLIVVAKGGYGIDVRSATNHGLSGHTSAPTKNAVVATHEGAAGTGAALYANGRLNKGVFVTNDVRRTPALDVNARRNDGDQNVGIAIRALAAGATPADIKETPTRGTTSAVQIAGQHGLYAAGVDGYGVRGESNRWSGVDGYSRDGSGVSGLGRYGADFHGYHPDQPVLGANVSAYSPVSNVTGLQVTASGANNARAVAIDTWGDVQVEGTVTRTAGRFLIDHPVTPDTKYLLHADVQSAERKNIYDGVAIADASGNAVVELPAWFEALNKDFRYQLTAIGPAAPELRVSAEVQSSRFTIAGAKSGQKVCWQVTGVRKDPWAAAHPFSPEQDKPPIFEGKYVFPEGYGKPASAGRGYERLKQARRTSPGR